MSPPSICHVARPHTEHGAPGQVPVGSSDFDSTCVPPQQLETATSRCKSTVMLVEHRDEVFARLAAELPELGMDVMRATKVYEAVRQSPSLIVVNADLPLESGWLYVAKVRLSQPQARIWVYVRHSAGSDVAMANFMEVDELIEYEDDLGRLAAEIHDRLMEYLSLTI